MMFKRLYQRQRRFILSAILLAALVIVLLMPLPKYIETPGGADNLKPFVSIPHHPDRASGQFMLTSVALMQARPISYVYALVNPTWSIEDADTITGGVNQATYDRVQTFYMQSAINEAIYTAFHAAKKPVTRHYLGIYVLDIDPQSAFKHKLAVGDTVVEVNHHHFASSSGFQQYIQRQRVGQKVSVTYQRDNHTRTVQAPLTRLPDNKAGIGIALTDNVKVRATPKVRVNPGDIGGPSGGLMFSLQIYSQLTGKDLRHGHKIAGTGTIDQQGQVGEIGGIDKKVIAAHRAGATIFLAPYVKPSPKLLQYEEHHQTNYQLAVATAKKYAPGMKVVPVTSFSQACHYLQDHR